MIVAENNIIIKLKQKTRNLFIRIHCIFLLRVTFINSCKCVSNMTQIMADKHASSRIMLPPMAYNFTVRSLFRSPSVFIGLHCLCFALSWTLVQYYYNIMTNEVCSLIFSIIFSSNSYTFFQFYQYQHINRMFYIFASLKPSKSFVRSYIYQSQLQCSFLGFNTLCSSIFQIDIFHNKYFSKMIARETGRSLQ